MLCYPRMRIARHMDSESVLETEMISSSLEFGFGGSESFVLPVSPIESNSAILIKHVIR